MTHRERVIRTFRFDSTDRLPYDLMEGSVWQGMLDYFRREHGLREAAEVLEFLDTDFRWVRMRDTTIDPSAVPPPGSPVVPDEKERQPKLVAEGVLSGARSVSDIDRFGWRDPADWGGPDWKEARRRWPEHALVFVPGWMPLFWGACEAFGFEEALVKMMGEPAIFDAFLRRHHEFYLEILRRGLEGAASHCDICWLGDDFATQQEMMLDPVLWRRYVRPYLAEQVTLARAKGLSVLFHSCGAVRPVLGDLIDMGVNGLLVFQTTARGMDARSIARDFGGKLVFYGGIDVQQTLSYGTPEEVREAVVHNARAFAHCGGYVVANSHSTVATIRPENIHAMCAAARRTPPDGSSVVSGPSHGGH